MKNKEAKALLDKYRSGTLSAHEQVQLDSWYLREAHSKNGPTDKDAMQRQLDEIEAALPVHHKQGIVKNIGGRLLVAAAILVSFSTGMYFYINSHSTPGANYASNSPKQNIVPGRDKAVLVLANGTKIDLDATANGAIAKQGGLTITKTKTGQLVYKASATINRDADAKLTYNTIETPRGGQYQIYLPDGTKVWLNSASSLKYPLQFATNERRVELTGEGYFEVAHNRAQPFKVVTDKQEIEVLGTHFNVNAYADEGAIKTTLLEGSVKIKVLGVNQVAQQMAVLKPGEQSAFNNAGLTIENIDVEDAIAWKNGYFKFNEDIESIMRKLSRWYNIDVVYNIDKDPDLSFGGKISRSKSINSVLNVIETTGNVHFKIEGRRVTVMK